MTRLIALLGLSLVASPAAAQLLDSARAMGMGGAVRGDPVAGSALLYNPAGMARAMVYEANVGYLRNGPGAQNALAATVVDSKTQPNLAMGVGYGYHFSDDAAPVDVSGHDVRLGFATALVPQQVFLGATARYAHFNRAGADDFKAFTLDAGLLFSPNQTFHVGLTAQNLVPTEDLSAPRRLGGGLGLTSGIMALDVDVFADMDSAEAAKPMVNAGLELLLGERLPLRGGFIYDGVREKNRVAFGLGFVDNGQYGGMQINLGAQIDLDDPERYDVALGISAFL